MQTFYEGWQIVQAFIASDAKVPSEVMLPRPPHREVARMLADRRNFSAFEVIDSLGPFSQPNLLRTEEGQIGLQALSGELQTDMMLAPVSLESS